MRLSPRPPLELCSIHVDRLPWHTDVYVDRLNHWRSKRRHPDGAPSNTLVHYTAGAPRLALADRQGDRISPVVFGMLQSAPRVSAV